MSDLVDRLRRWAADAPPWIAMPYAGEAADRIEALEAKAAHWKERHDTVLQKHIECCSVSRIEALEAALREIAELKIKVHSSGVPQEIASAALAPEQDK